MLLPSISCSRHNNNACSCPAPPAVDTTTTPAVAEPLLPSTLQRTLRRAAGGVSSLRAEVTLDAEDRTWWSQHGAQPRQHSHTCQYAHCCQHAYTCPHAHACPHPMSHVCTRLAGAPRAQAAGAVGWHARRVGGRGGRRRTPEPRAAAARRAAVRGASLPGRACAHRFVRR
eukprot:363790-Chlamydomonas_euryale.AAC.3